MGIPEKVAGLRMRRKWMVREKCHLQFCYEAVLQFVQEFLMKRKCEGEWMKSLGNVILRESLKELLYNGENV